MSKLPPIPVADQLFLTLPQVAALLGYTSVDPVYQRIKDGLPVVRIGGRLRVHGPSLREWAARLTAEQTEERAQIMDTLLVEMRRKSG